MHGKTIPSRLARTKEALKNRKEAAIIPSAGEAEARFAGQPARPTHLAGPPGEMKVFQVQVSRGESEVEVINPTPAISVNWTVTRKVTA